MDYQTTRLVVCGIIGVATAQPTVSGLRLATLKRKLERSYWRIDTRNVVALRMRLSDAIWSWKRMFDIGLCIGFALLAVSSYLVMHMYD